MIMQPRKFEKVNQSLQEIRKQSQIADLTQPLAVDVNRSVVIKKNKDIEREKVHSQPSLSANDEEIDFNVDVKEYFELNQNRKTAQQKRPIQGRTKLVLNPTDGKRNSVEKSQKEQPRSSAGIVRDVDDKSNSSSYKAVEQQLRQLIPNTDNEDPDRGDIMSSDSYTGPNSAAQRAAIFKSIKVRQREEMNSLIIEEERREKNRVIALAELSNEPDRRKLAAQHHKEREIASQRVKQLINVHLYEIQKASGAQKTLQKP